MKKYMMTVQSTFRDELQAAGDGVPFQLNNINVADDATFKRGDLVAADSVTATFKLATAADSSKMLGIIAEDFNADSDHTVATAYVAGKFHRDKVNPVAVVDSLELELKRQGIFFTTLTPNFD